MPTQKKPPRPVRTREQWLETAKTLSEALPYMRLFAGQTFVIKFGGHAMGDDTLTETLVHGGGPQIGDMLRRLGIESRFERGLRVTDKATIDIVEMVLAGSINKSIVSAIEDAGGHAVGISGKDGSLVEARKLKAKRPPRGSVEKVTDLGYVGEPTKINPHVLEVLMSTDVIPVVAPIGIGPEGETYNINADTVAGAIAAAMGASKLILLTDVEGVLDKNKKLVAKLTSKEAKAMLADGTATGGMIPKLETCLTALAGGCKAAHILDGRQHHVLLLEVFTELGIGTMISPDGTAQKKS
jgi:acetylglutamate kinase